MLQK
jgi:hypothetical protein